MNEKVYLVFDIETSPLPYESFSASQQEYLIRGAKTGEEVEKKLAEMGLTPLTAQVVTIGMKIIERKSPEELEDTIRKEQYRIALAKGEEKDRVYMSLPRPENKPGFMEKILSGLDKQVHAKIIERNIPPDIEHKEDLITYEDHMEIFDESDIQGIEEERVKDYKSGELTDKYKEMDFPEYNIKSVALMTNPEMTEEDEPINEKIDGISYYQTTEKRVLETFWKTIEKYKGCVLITFNGRNFDAPFLMLRSAILEVKPLRNLMDGTKFSYYNHIDLADELTFYSPSSYGATKRFNFDFYTRAFGLVSPKSEGIDGSLVSVFYNEGDYQKIAEYCMRDVDATWKLYVRIKEYINIKV